jgi:nitrite reductase (NADH) small subunit
MSLMRMPDTDDQSLPAAVWVAVCALDDIIPDTGVCALLGGRQIAVVRVGAGEQVFAVDNFDPFSKAFVISRGIVGDKDGVAKITSPIFKQGFNRATGQCLENPAVALAAYPVRVRDGQVEVLVEAIP